MRKCNLIIIALLLLFSCNINAHAKYSPHIKESKITRTYKRHRDYKHTKRNYKSSWKIRRKRYLKYHWYYLLGKDMAKEQSPNLYKEFVKYGKPYNSRFKRGFTSKKYTSAINFEYGGIYNKPISTKKIYSLLFNRINWPVLRAKYLKKHQYYLLGQKLTNNYTPNIVMEVIKYGKPYNTQFIKGFTRQKYFCPSSAYKYNTNDIIKEARIYLNNHNYLFRMGWMMANLDYSSETYRDTPFKLNHPRMDINYIYDYHYHKYGNKKQFENGWITYIKNLNHSNIDILPHEPLLNVYHDLMLNERIMYNMIHGNFYYRMGAKHDDSAQHMNPKYKHNKQYRRGWYDTFRLIGEYAPI